MEGFVGKLSTNSFNMYILHDKIKNGGILRQPKN